MAINHIQFALDKMDELFFGNTNIPGKADTRAKTRAMVRAYYQVYKDVNNGFLVTGVEKTLYGPIQDPKTKKDSGYTAAGKLDVTLSEKEGRKHNIILDHKFLSYSFDQDDIDHLKMAGQPCHYVYLGWMNKMKFDSIIWDIIVKPQYRRHKASSRVVVPARAERVAGRKITQDGVEYSKGDTVPGLEEVREYTPEETVEEFEERVFNSMLEGRERFFKRERVTVVPSAILEHVLDLYEWTRELAAESAASRHLRNVNVCKEYNSWCNYIGLCSGNEDEDDSGRWKKIGSNHQELNLPPGLDPAKVITNSRMSVFKSCRLKHHRRYNQGLVRIGEELNDALFIGSAGHIGLEYLFKALGSEQRGLEIK